MKGELRDITDKHPAIHKMVKHFERTWSQQMGTLSGGNHFIELCMDEQQQVWLMLHSGSRGKGNAESFCSCSHGAGRRMSRSKAKTAFSEADLIAQTSGVECRKD